MMSMKALTSPLSGGGVGGNANPSHDLNARIQNEIATMIAQRNIHTAEHRSRPVLKSNLGGSGSARQKFIKRQFVANPRSNGTES